MNKDNVYILEILMSRDFLVILYYFRSLIIEVHNYFALIWLWEIIIEMSEYSLYWLRKLYLFSVFQVEYILRVNVTCIIKLNIN